MGTRRLRLFTCVILLFVATGSASAQGLLGTRFAGLEFGFTRPGDDVIRSIDESVVGVAGLFNSPLDPRLDLSVMVSHDRFSGEGIGVIDDGPGNIYFFPVDIEVTTWTAGSLLTYHTSPGESVDPFVGAGVMFVDTDPSGAESESHWGFSLGAGAEFALGERSSLSPAMFYSRLDDFDDLGFGLTFGSWFSERYGATLEGVYWTEDGDIRVAAGLLVLI